MPAVGDTASILPHLTHRFAPIYRPQPRSWGLWAWYCVFLHQPTYRLKALLLSPGHPRCLAENLQCAYTCKHYLLLYATLDTSAMQRKLHLYPLTRDCIETCGRKKLGHLMTMFSNLLAVFTKIAAGPCKGRKEPGFYPNKRNPELLAAYLYTVSLITNLKFIFFGIIIFFLLHASKN